MRHLGDVSKVNGAEVEPVDVITFGSPCQDLSVAGKRAGLRHTANGDEETTRSGLFMEAVRIIREMREATNGKYPTFALWENVPGAFSSNAGEDFRIVCEELIKIVEPSAFMPAVPKGGWPYADCYCGDGWSLAYRVFDAQHWGVPQRRRRIYLVADFRGERAGAVLFEREGLRGHFASGRTPWQGAAGDAANGADADDREGNCLTPWDVQSRRVYAEDGAWPALYAGEGGGHGYCCYPVGLMDSIGGQAERGWIGDIAPTLKAVHYKFAPCVVTAAGFKAGQGAKARGIGWDEECSPTLAAEAGGNCVPSVCIKTFDARGNGDGDTVGTITGDHEGRITDYTSVIVEKNKPVFCLQGNGIDRADTAGCNGKGWKEDVCYTLNTIDRPGVAYSIGNGQLNQISMSETCNTLDCMHDKQAVLVAGVDCRNATEYPEKTGTLQAKANGGFSANCNQIVRTRYIVRRLTPTECARLQGFPDDWGHPDIKDDLSDEEGAFWQEARNTHAAINGKAAKSYTKAQMLTWYNKLHTDGAEYKMWGNGIALPTALYVMQGIADALEAEVDYG